MSQGGIWRVYGFVAAEALSNNTLSCNTAHQNVILDSLNEGSGSGDVWFGNHFGTTSGI